MLRSDLRNDQVLDQLRRRLAFRLVLLAKDLEALGILKTAGWNLIVDGLLENTTTMS